MASLDDVSIAGLVARRTVKDYGTYRYVMVHHPQVLLTMPTPLLHKSIVNVPGFSTLSESQRVAVLAEIKYGPKHSLDCPRDLS